MSCIQVQRSRFNLADGLKKAGTFGGTLPESDEAGTNSLVLPSMVSTNSEDVQTILGTPVLSFRYLSVNEPSRLTHGK